MKFTDRTVASLPSPERGQKLYTDDALPGFGLRVGINSKTFVLTIGPERQRITIGRYLPAVFGLAQARAKAKTILAQRQLGLDPPLTPRFEEVQEEYLVFRDRSVRAVTRKRDNAFLAFFKPISRKRIGNFEGCAGHSQPD